MTTLYEKLGGKAAVEAAVDIFYQKVLADPMLKDFFSSTNMDEQIKKQKVFLTYAFGGLENYTGKSMREAHQHLSITDAHFNAVANHLKNTLEELSVSKDLIDEVMIIAGSTHDDIVTSH